MSKNKFRLPTVAALAATVIFSSSFSQAQTRTNPYAPKIKTPNTKNELIDKSEPARKDVAEEALSEDSGSSSSTPSAPAQRRLQQHGLGLGIGQTFLLGNYGKSGEDKITGDILYTYAASHSFDLLVTGHNSQHQDNKKRMRVRGLTAGVKGRFVEYDNFSPFIHGGLGFYAPQARRRVNTTYKWTDQKITFGLNFGGGFDLRLNDQFVVGIMGTLHAPFKVTQDDQSDLKGYYFKLLLTGMYLF